MAPQCYCIEQPRCRTCQFKLETNELIVAAKNDGGVSQAFNFHRGSTFYDESIDIEFHMCFSSHCSKTTLLTFCFHSRCYSSPYFLVKRPFLSATRYSFVPSIQEDTRRAHYIQGRLSQNLRKAVECPRELPPELWDMIAGYLVEPCAAITAQEQVREDRDQDKIERDFTQNVYASFVKIEGRCYVRALHNTPGAHSDTQTVFLVLPARHNQEGEMECDRRAEKDLFVAMDHIGIRRLVFVSPENCNEWCRNQSSVPGIWWRHVPREVLHSEVLIERDGMKVRDLRHFVKSPTDLLTCIGWPVPFYSSPTVINATVFEGPSVIQDSLRMSCIDCNAPDTLGYYVATDGMRILSMLTHKRDQQLEMSLFEDFGTSVCFWMYMPINQDEHLTDICRRAKTGVPRTEEKTLGFTFTTNLGRTVDFGSYTNDALDFRRVAKLGPDSCREYFNVDYSTWEAQWGRELMAFDNHLATSTDDELPKLPGRISDCPHAHSNQDWPYSSCTMSGVIEIHACIDQTVSHRPLLGLLLYYADNHRECVGQFRPDWAAEPIQVGETDKIYICYKRTEQDLGHVVAVTTCPPAQDTSNNWVAIEQTGTLEWWFSSQHSVLRHDGTQLSQC